MKAKAPPRKTIALIPTPSVAIAPVLTPTQAPRTVGSIESASSQ